MIENRFWSVRTTRRTAQIAINSALTANLVVTTVHATQRAWARLGALPEDVA